MQRALVIALLFVPVVGVSDERMADVAAYINAMWFAEEYNEQCPQSPIEIPLTEVGLRKLVILIDGENIVDRAARGPTGSNMNYRDGMKDLARESIAEGCRSKIALLMRAKVEENLVVPDLIKEFQKNPESSPSEIHTRNIG